MQNKKYLAMLTGSEKLALDEDDILNQWNSCMIYERWTRKKIYIKNEMAPTTSAGNQFDDLRDV